ncbi:MBL fold metallo-hydrolase [Kribbella sp. NPDC048915]|uniref:MBL fold metallo-hydrolase n=1 Tax=Kribbella sp. NPDC048915 TaxID=3155148 RepID=UPI0034085083
MLTGVGEGVFAHQSELLRNNSVVVQGRAGVLVVDPGITEGELSCLVNDVRTLGQPVVAGFATHPDWDHALWHPDLGEAPRYGTAAAVTFLQELLSADDWKAQLAEGLPPEIADETPLDLFGLLTPVGGDTLPWDGPDIRIVEHPAHSTGHAALVIEDSGVLVAGDMLSDVLVPFPDPGAADPLGDYLAGLQALEDVADSVETVVPGHGSVGRGADIRARIDLDRAYVETLRAGRAPEDPRLSPDATFGDWLPGLAEWHLEQFGGKSR